MKTEQTGAELIALERQEQIEKHERTVELDVKNNNTGELLVGAKALMGRYPEHIPDRFPAKWNREICVKMANKPTVERLVIAGAFIAAEIDRINSQEQ